MSDAADSETPAGTALAVELGDELRDREETIATAESCTGGLVGAALTAVPGSSEYFDRSLVAYAYDAKRQLLGVNREDLDAHGAVSEPVARQMARGVRDTADVTWGVGVTGVAGPGGGTGDTPVGTVYIGVAYAAPWGTNESGATVARYEFEGDRTAVRAATVRQALEDVLTELRRRSQASSQ